MNRSFIYFFKVPSILKTNNMIISKLCVRGDQMEISKVIEKLAGRQPEILGHESTSKICCTSPTY